MDNCCIPELEALVYGKSDSIELVTNDTTREDILMQISSIITNLFPGAMLNGEFLNKDDSNYLVYEMHFSGIQKTSHISPIRLLDFGDKFLLVRV